jgi:undecaprenyl diphosphate synthase
MQRLHTGVPRHVAIIMDGNGRWATARHLPRMAGHNRGMKSVRAVVESCGQRGIEYLTLFAFSSENWRRPADEVSTLMRLFVTALQKEVGKLVDRGVRLRVVGELTTLAPELQRQIVEAELRTAANTQLQLTLCVSYGGRWDIVQAARTVVREQGVEALDEGALGQRLALAFAPEPDLLIRTGGEQRISNFLLWQCAYAELYFTHAMWPDFSAAAFDEALAWYAQRERRFGRTTQQLAASS